jgi:hypothetical protein
MSTLTPELVGKMNALANELGEHFANEPNRERVLLWLDVLQNELVDVCSPINRLNDLRNEFDAIDAMLDRIEARRAEIVRMYSASLMLGRMGLALPIRPRTFSIQLEHRWNARRFFARLPPTAGRPAVWLRDNK